MLVAKSFQASLCYYGLHIHLFDSFKQGHYVTTVKAVDLDSAINAPIEYTIYQGVVWLKRLLKEIYCYIANT